MAASIDSAAAATYLFVLIISTVRSRRRRHHSREVSFGVHALFIVDLRLYSGDLRIQR